MSLIQIFVRDLHPVKVLASILEELVVWRGGDVRLNHVQLPHPPGQHFPVVVSQPDLVQLAVHLLLLQGDVAQPAPQGVLLHSGSQVNALIASPQALPVQPDVRLAALALTQRVLVFRRIVELDILEVGIAKDRQGLLGDGDVLKVGRSSNSSSLVLFLLNIGEILINIR